MMARPAVMRFASLGHYRLRTFRELTERMPPEELEIQAGDRSPDGTVRVITQHEFSRLTTLKNRYLAGDVLIQSGGLRRALAAQTLIIDLNPRVLDVWVLLGIRAVLRRRTLVWGHAWPRRGSVTRPGLLRGVLRRLSDGVVTYTRGQARELSQGDPRLAVFPAPNALYRREEMFHSPIENPNCVIYVGRLIAEKKVADLLLAFDAAWQEHPQLQLIVIGDGPERTDLSSLSLTLASRGSIQFRGHVDDLSALRNEYSRAFLAVSPGYAGLSVTQSLAFGVPIAVSKFEPHAPEVEAIKPGFNGVFFEGVDALRHQIVNFYAERSDWRARGNEIARGCAEEYSVEAMVDGLMSALKGRP